ncbi:MAG: phosphoenolpyruvate carboxykinase (ATP), partial [Candidatus Marinimicrobia bacterium]|nr:phosphoenolpyruvate carboxykinase (ATP) [Candidatus Neomarinimicrobiota bacterium]
MKMNGNDLGLDQLGLTNLTNVHRNLPAKELVDDIVNNGEGVIGLRGAAMVDTGIYTGRSPKDKYIVDEPSSNDKIWWGPVNRKISEDIFNTLYEKVVDYYNSADGSKTYIFDGFAGADANYSLNVRIIAKKAWQAHF